MSTPFIHKTWDTVNMTLFEKVCTTVNASLVFLVFTDQSILPLKGAIVQINNIASIWHDLYEAGLIDEETYSESIKKARDPRDL